MPMKIFFGGKWTDTNVVESPEKAVVDTRSGETISINSSRSGLLLMITGKLLDSIQLYVDEGGSLNSMFRNTPSLDYFNGTPHNFKNATSTYEMFRDSSVERVFGIFNTENLTSMYGMFDGSNLREFIAYDFNTSKVVDMSRMFRDCNHLELVEGLAIHHNGVFGNLASTATFNRGNPELKLKNVDVGNITSLANMFRNSNKGVLDVGEIINTHNIESLSRMFYNSNLREYKLGALDTTSVTNMNEMFYGCSNLELVDGLELHNNTTVRDMFVNGNPDLELRGVDAEGTNTLARMFWLSNKRILDVGEIINTHNVESMYQMFRDSGLQEYKLGALDTTSTTNMNEMFNRCSDLEFVEGLELHNNTTVNDMFTHGNPDLELRGVDAEGTNTLARMFWLSNKRILDVGEIINTHNVENLHQMFRGSGLRELKDGALDTTSVTSMNEMFYDCSDLESVTLRSLENVTNSSSAFAWCTSLTHLELHGLGEGFQINPLQRELELSYTALNKEGLEHLAHTLGVTITNYPWRLIYRSEVAWDTSIATSKGWIVLKDTDL